MDRHALLTIFVFVAPRGGRTRVWMRGERKAASGGLVYLLGLCGDGKCKNVQPKLILSGFMCHPCAGQVLETTPTLVTRPLLR